MGGDLFALWVESFFPEQGNVGKSVYQYPSWNSDSSFISAKCESKRLDIFSELFRAFGSEPGRRYKSYGRSMGLYHELVYYRGEKTGFSEWIWVYEMDQRL